MGIINTLNIEELKQQYRETGYVVIKNLLRDEVAQAAYEALKNRVPWEFHYREMNTGTARPNDRDLIAGGPARRVKPYRSQAGLWAHLRSINDRDIEDLG